MLNFKRSIPFWNSRRLGQSLWTWTNFYTANCLRTSYNENIFWLWD